MAKKLLCYFGLLFFALVYSCGLSGPKPDKRVVATLEVVGDDISEEEMKEAMEAIKNRFTQWGAYPEIEYVPNTNTLSFTLETAADQERILKFLTVRANLEFFEVISKEKMMSFVIAANQMIGGDEYNEVDALMGKADDEENVQENAPLLDKLQADTDHGGMFSVLEADTSTVMGYLRRNDVAELLESKKKNTKFVWGLKSKSSGAFTLYALRTLVSGKARLDGSSIKAASQDYSMTGMPTVTIIMNEEGIKIWTKLTEEAFQANFQIAIVLDNIVHSAPAVNNGAIYGGRSDISGNFTEEEANDLASMISAGAIPETKVLSFDVEPLE